MSNFRQTATSDTDSSAFISSNSAVTSGFALTRFTMAAVILGTLLIGGFEQRQSSLFVVQAAVALVAVVAIAWSLRTVVQQLRKRSSDTSLGWPVIALDSFLAIGVMAVIDVDTSPLAWVALITPVLETAVLFSISGSAFVWMGLSLAFLALRLTTNASDDATTETLILSIQQVLAVLFVSGPAALMVDSAQDRIHGLAKARHSADRNAKRLHHITETARQMSNHQDLNDVLSAVSESGASIGFDQADVVIRNSQGELLIHSSNSHGPAARIPPELLNAGLSDSVGSITDDDSVHGEMLKLNGVRSGHAIELSSYGGSEHPEAVLRVWSRRDTPTEEDLQALALLGGHAREAYRATQRLQEAQSHADQLLHEVRHDGLTGLANRAFVLETLNERIKNQEPMALLFLDLDGFKAVNDTLGHSAGDDALVAVAERLRSTGRDHELAGRMGGDEFILLTPFTAFDSLESLHAYGAQIVSAVSEPIATNNTTAQLGASVGIALHDGVLGPDQFISLADDAMYEACLLYTSPSPRDRG